RQVGDVVCLEGRGPVRVKQNGPRALPPRVRATGNHQRAGGCRRLALSADRVILKLIHIDRAGRREGELQQLLALITTAQFGEQVRDRERAQLRRRARDELAAHGWHLGCSGTTALAAAGREPRRAGEW